MPEYTRKTNIMAINKQKVNHCHHLVSSLILWTRKKKRKLKILLCVQLYKKKNFFWGFEFPYIRQMFRWKKKRKIGFITVFSFVCLCEGHSFFFTKCPIFFAFFLSFLILFTLLLLFTTRLPLISDQDMIIWWKVNENEANTENETKINVKWFWEALARVFHK